MELAVVVGVIALGIVHGVLPDHGWPIAATYALAHPRKWIRGTAAALILGIGHLISSVALVLAYFWFSRFAAFAEGPWMKPLAGALLIALGIYEYASGGHGHAHDLERGHEHDHSHENGHDHEHGHTHDHEHGHTHDYDHEHTHAHTHGDEHARAHVDSHAHEDDAHEDERGHDHAPDGGSESGQGLLGRVRSFIPGGGHAHPTQEHAEQGLLSLGAVALLLGFAHEEPVQILAICAGTDFCLELMLIYSLAVIGAILAPTLLLIAGYERHQEKVERWTPHLPAITAAVLVAVGLWFVLSGAW